MAEKAEASNAKTSPERLQEEGSAPAEGEPLSRSQLAQKIRELETRLQEKDDEMRVYQSFYRKYKARIDVMLARKGAQGSAVFDLGEDADEEDDDDEEEEEEEGGRGGGNDGDEEGEHGSRCAFEPWSKTLGRNTSLEYTRDSPMFRQRLGLFVHTLEPLKAYVDNLTRMTREYCQAGQALRSLGVALAEELCSRKASRMLFTSSNQEMGDLAENLAAFSGLFKQVQELLGILMYSLEGGLAAPLEDFSSTFKDVASLFKDLVKKGAVFETALGKCLEAKELPTEGKRFERVMAARGDFELFRFDVVKYINQLDTRKQRLFERGVNNAYYAFFAFFHGGLDSLLARERIMRKRQARLDKIALEYQQDDVIWRGVRSRVEAELQGALPPPGAPVGALAPISMWAATPPYVGQITTEVLSRDSQAASHTDLEHARDGAVLKQGYLYRRYIFRKERKWHRLHQGKLYTMEEVPLSGAVARADPLLAEVGPKLVLDLATDYATVNVKPPGACPFCFIVVKEDGYRIELQAENEDDMLQWISAIRRCRRAIQVSPPPGLLKESGGLDSSSREREDEDAQNLLQTFVERNLSCGECGDSSAPPLWLSVTLGMTLCPCCADLHAKLGNKISTLRSINLDRWSVFVVQSILMYMGNARAARVWEANVSEGWHKPHSNSPLSEKEQWVLAKYRWFGFVEEDKSEGDKISRQLAEAAAENDVSRVMWCLAHKGDVKWRHPGRGGRTALHLAALSSHLECCVMLLLHGADMHQLDGSDGDTDGDDDGDDDDNTHSKDHSDGDDDGGKKRKEKRKRMSSLDQVLSTDPASELSRMFIEKQLGELW